MNTGVESAVLATALTNAESVPKVAALPSDAFESGQYRAIHKAMVELAGQGLPVDVVTVTDSLQRVERVDCLEALLGLGESAASFSDVTPYTRLLLDAKRRRDAIGAAQRLAGLLARPESDLGADVTAAIGALQECAAIPGSDWDLLALSPERFLRDEPHEFEFILPGLLAKGVVGFLYGEGGSFKSLAALWLVLQRATAGIHSGQRWLDKFPVPRGRSVFISAEDVDADLHSRTRRVVEAIAGGRPDVPLGAFCEEAAKNCLIVSREGWKADGEQFLVDERGNTTGKLKQIVKAVSSFGADLVVVETVSRFANSDENDNRLAARVVGALEEIRDCTGATVLAIAHTSKAARGGRSDTHGQNGLRGGGALMDNARFGLWFRAQPKSDGGCDVVEIVNSKTFRTQRAQTFSTEVCFPSFRVAEAQSCTDTFDAVLDDVREFPGSPQREIRGRLKIKQSTLTQALKDGLDEGFIESLKTGGYRVI
jgi:hypothetical protein